MPDTILTQPAPPRSARALPGLLSLCLLLGICAFIAAGMAVYLLLIRQPFDALLALLVGVVMAAAAVGLYRLRRWGVICFGILAVAGSINHLTSVLMQYNNASAINGVNVLPALFAILLAVFIPLGLIYITLLLWRQTR